MGSGRKNARTNVPKSKEFGILAMKDPDNDRYYEEGYDSPNFKPERDPDDVRDERVDDELLDEDEK